MTGRPKATKAAKPTVNKPKLVAPSPPNHNGDQVAAAGYSQVVKLDSGSMVTLTVGGNPLSFTSDDREFVFKLVDAMNTYRERRMLTAGSPANQEAT